MHAFAIACLFTFLAATGDAAAQLASTPTVIERPEWSVGDWWEFQRDSNAWRLTVIEREGDHYVLARSARGETTQNTLGRTRYHADLDGWITKTIAPGEKVTDSGDKREWVKFPLRVGTRWFFSVVSTFVGRSELHTFDYDCRAEGWDTIDIGGRPVRAIKIAVAQRLRGGSYGAGITGWYAPEAKRLVRLTPHYAGGPSVDVIGFGGRGGDSPTVVATGRPSPPVPPTVPAPLKTKLEIKAPGGATVSVGGQQHRVAPDGALTVPLAPGSYEIAASRDGYEPWRATVVLDARERFAYVIDLIPLTPPTIAIREPGAAQIFRDAQGRIRVEVSSAYRLAALTAKQPGATPQVFAPPATAAAGQGWDVNVDVTLSQGDNTVELEARDEHGGTTTQIVTLRREPPAPSVAAAPPSAVRPPSAVPPSPTPPTKYPTKPPVIALNYPPADLAVERDQIVVVGLITADAGLAHVQMTVNGADVTSTTEIKAGSRGVPVRATVKLLTGDNIIELTATDKAGNVVQLVRTVTRAAPPATPVSANRLAVIIGIGEYENQAIPSLRYAANDAEAMHQVLIARAGFKKENILLLTDRTPQRPTLRNIKSALGTFLARSARKDDTVLVFFAGHGAPEVDLRGLERDGLTKYLIPSDADPNDLYATALSMDEIHTIFGRIEADRVVVFLDSCYSGAAGGRTFASNRLRTRDLNVDDLFLERLTRSKGRAIIAASRTSEVSLEVVELGHGLFTYYLVQGLNGAADLDRDGIVTLQELYAYVEREVSRKSRAIGGNQHPVLKGEMEGPFPLASIKAR